MSCPPILPGALRNGGMGLTEGGGGILQYVCYQIVFPNASAHFLPVLGGAGRERGELKIHTSFVNSSTHIMTHTKMIDKMMDELGGKVFCTLK